MEIIDTKKKLSYTLTFKQALEVGVKNVPSIMACVALFLLTCWIPYINIGVLIALTLLPVQLAKGEIINPLSIFDSKYRKYIGEFILTYSLMLTAIMISLWFMIIPAIVVGISWSLALYYLLDRGMNPLQAIMASNNATYGSKWTIFFVKLTMGFCFMIINGIMGALFGGTLIGSILLVILIVTEVSVAISVSASIWGQLKDNVK